MKRVLLVIAALLSLTVLLAACKKSGDTISTSTAESTPETVEATPAPTELPPYEANVLTGEPKGADYPEGQRITAVMVNNIVAARPQRGLSKADILFEIKVEGGITRFMPALSAVPFIPGISSAPSAPVVVPFSICIPVIAGSGMFMAGSGSETFHGSVPATDRSFRRPVPGFLFSVSCPALPTFRSFPFSPMPPPFAGSLIFAESFCFPVPLFCTGMCRVARPKA